MAYSKKLRFPKPPILNIFFAKITENGPCVDRID